MIRVLILIGIFFTLSESASKRRRLFGEVRSIRDDVNNVVSNVSILFNSVDKINNTMWSNYDKIHRDLSQGRSHYEEIVAEIYARGVTNEEFAILTEAFESEKYFNRQLQDKLIELEENNTRLSEIERSNEDVLKELEFQRFVNSVFSDRLNALENDHSNIEKNCLGIEKELQRQLQNGLQSVEESISAFHREVAANMTSIIKLVEVMSRKNTNDNLQGFGNDDGEPEMEKTTASNALGSCREAPNSGVYDVILSSTGLTKSVYCDAETDEEGWLVIIRRQDGSVNFNRTWNDYKNGFGELDGEFWIGNDILHDITKSKPMELRVDMETFRGHRYFAKYGQFQVGSEADKYILTVSGYNGTAGDSINHEHMVHNGMYFSTIDSDNDRDYELNCAFKYSGGWWYSNCFRALPTGPYSLSWEIDWWRGVIWYTLTEDTTSLKFIEMKIR